MLWESGLEIMLEDDSAHTFDFEMPAHERYSDISSHPGSVHSMGIGSSTTLAGPKKRLASTRLQDLLRMGIIKRLHSTVGSKQGSSLKVTEEKEGESGSEKSEKHSESLDSSLKPGMKR